MLISLDIYSGRPNPTWVLSAKDADSLVQRVEGRAVAEASEVEGVLGFRGFVVSAMGDEALPADLPASFRVASLLPADAAMGDATAKPLSADESDEAMLWLMSSGRHVVDDELQAYVADALQTRFLDEGPAEPAAEEDEAVEALACVIANTAYNPAFWNQAAVQPRNNCYNYAMNYRSDTFAQPGRISGHPTNVMQCANVASAANWDGCTAVCNGSNKNVALVVWPGRDYHWYRRHSNSFWGHKPGSTAARNTDNSNRVIDGRRLTPMNCNRGPYTLFCGYRYSPTGMRVR